MILGDFTDADPLKGRIYFYSGTDLARDSAFAWVGLTGATVGRLDADGPRFRIMAGAGRYRYRTAAVPGGVNEGRVSSGEILFGHRQAIGAFVVTGYLGAHAEEQRLRIPDPGNRAAGAAVGVKAVIETFLRFDPAWSMIGFASVSTVHRDYHARAALMREHPSGWASGVEAAVHGDARYVEPRLGVFAQSTFHQSVVTLAGGALSNSDKGKGLYATISLYAPY